MTYAGDDQLQPGAGGVQIRVDGGGRDVHHGGIQDRHELPGEDDRQQGARRGQPARGPALGPAGPAEPGAAASGHVVAGYGALVCHASEHAGTLIQVPGAYLSWYQEHLAPTPAPRHDEVYDRHDDQRERLAPRRAGRVPAQPPGADQPGAGGAAPGAAPPHPRAAPGGGRPAGRGGRHLVHLARAGPPDQGQRPGAGRGGPDAPARPGRAAAPVPAGRHRGSGRRARAHGERVRAGPAGRPGHHGQPGAAPGLGAERAV